MCTLRNRYITHHHHLLTSISIQLFILQYCTVYICCNKEWVVMLVFSSNYWQLMSQRAAGKLMTNAHWIRNFIRSHPEYRQLVVSVYSIVLIMLYTVLWCRMDSRVPEGAVYDLILAINAIQTGQCSDPTLFVKAERVTRTADYPNTSDSESDQYSTLCYYIHPADNNDNICVVCQTEIDYLDRNKLFPFQIFIFSF